MREPRAIDIFASVGGETALLSETKFNQRTIVFEESYGRFDVKERITRLLSTKLYLQNLPSIVVVASLQGKGYF